MSQAVFESNRVAVETDAVPNDQDLAITGFPGTPVGLMVGMSDGTPDATGTGHARMTMGFSDGTNERSIAIRAQGGDPVTVNTVQIPSNSHVLNVVNSSTGAIAGSASHVAATTPFSDGKATIEWDNALATTAFMMNYTLIGGENTEVAVGDFLSASGAGSTIDVRHTNLTGKPDVIWLLSQAQAFNDTVTDDARFCQGFGARGASDEVQQAYNAWSSEDAAGAAHNNGYQASNSRVCGVIDPATPSFLGSVSIDAWLDDNGSGGGATFETLDSGTQIRYAYMMVRDKVERIEASIEAVDSETSTGSQASTTAGFKPQFLEHLSGFGTATLDILHTNANADPIGRGWASTNSPTSGVCMSISTDDGNNNAVAESFRDNALGYVERANDTSGLTVSHTSFDTNGHTLNYDRVLGGAKTQLFLSIKEAETSHPSYGEPDQGRPTPNTLLRM